MSQPDLPTPSDVQAAHRRIASAVHRTPVFTCATLDAELGATAFLKAENLQKVGAFKFRGATNTVRSLDPEIAARGVVTHSSGNHAQAVALAAKQADIPAWIVMPEGAPEVKVRAVRGYGATVVRCAPTLAAREETAERVRVETGATLIHPYNDARVIAGQGTAALELLDACGPLDLLLAPLGGGGLLSGCALAALTVDSPPHVIGVEPEMADDAVRSLEAGHIIDSVNPQTIADGLRTSLGSLTFAIIQEHVDSVVTVSEAAIARAMQFVYERMKLVIEPSAAVCVAALLDGAIVAPGQRIGLILTGGNLDLTRLPELLATT